MASDAFLGEIRLFSFANARIPEDWMICDGSLLPVVAYEALFSLIGPQFGGDGLTNFALPDLRGRSPIGTGQGQQLKPIALAEHGGTEEVSLLQSNLPTHTHSAAFSPASSLQQSCYSGNGGLTSPANAVPSTVSESSIGLMNGYASPNAANAKMAPIPLAGVQIEVGPAGGGQSFDMRNPYLGLTFCICVNGIWPTSP